MNISVCIITDNDKRILKAIESVEKICNEIIIVETTNKNEYVKETEKIKLYYRKWDDNFSSARNYAISKAKKGNWILFIDSDEVLQGEILQLPDKYDAYYLTVSSNGSESLSARLFKNNGIIKFENAVHETIEYTIDIKKCCRTNLKIIHNGYTNQETLNKKLIRNFRILCRDKQMKLRSYYLALTYFHYGKLNKAIQHAENGLKENLPDEVKAKLSSMLFDCYNLQGHTNVYYLFKSLRYFPQQVSARLKLAEHLTDAKHKLKQYYELVNILYKGKTQMQNDTQLNSNFLKQKIKELQLCQ